MSISVWQILYCKFIVVHIYIYIFLPPSVWSISWLIDPKICYYFFETAPAFFFQMQLYKIKASLSIFTFAVVIIALSARDVTVYSNILHAKKSKSHPSWYHRYLKLSLRKIVESLISEMILSDFTGSWNINWVTREKKRGENKVIKFEEFIKAKKWKK